MIYYCSSYVLLLYFFFESRGRHTIFDCDWSSDVCSSDLALGSIHLALVRGRPSPQTEILVRVHEPLSVVDLLDAGPGTHAWGVGEALEAIGQAGTGAMGLLNRTPTSEALEARPSRKRAPRGGPG